MPSPRETTQDKPRQEVLPKLPMGQYGRAKADSDYKARRLIDGLAASPDGSKPDIGMPWLDEEKVRQGIGIT